MEGFLATRLIEGKLKWATLEKSKAYSKYCDGVLEVLHSRGYEINQKGDCVPIEKNDTVA